MSFFVYDFFELNIVAVQQYILRVVDCQLEDYFGLIKVVRIRKWYVILWMTDCWRVQGTQMTAIKFTSYKCEVQIYSLL